MTQDSLPAAPDGHALFSPSASARWLNCPGSFLPCAREPDAPSVDAAEGTVLHEIAATWLRRGVEPPVLGTIMTADGIGFEITRERMDLVQENVEHVQRICDGVDEMLLEKWVDTSPWMPIPKQGGTCDVQGLRLSLMGGTAIVADHKFGRVRVDVETEQVKIYALGVFNEWDWLYNFKRFDLWILQPRVGRPQLLEISRADLLAFGEDVKRKAAECLRPDAPRTPGEKQCAYCKAKATCPAHVIWLEQMTQADGDVFDAVTPSVAAQAVARLDAGQFKPSLAPVADLTTAQLAKVYRHKSMVAGYFNAAYAELYRRASDGETVDGFAMKPGRGERKWADELKAAAFLVSSGVPPVVSTMISPAQAEDALNAKRPKGVTKAAIAEQLVAFTVKPPGRPVLAPIRDGRPELEDDGDVFDAQDS